MIRNPCRSTEQTDLAQHGEIAGIQPNKDVVIPAKAGCGVASTGPNQIQQASRNGCYKLLDHSRLYSNEMFCMTGVLAGLHKHQFSTYKGCLIQTASTRSI